MTQDDESTARIKTSRLDIERLNQYFDSLEFCRLPQKSKKLPAKEAATSWRIVLISLNSQRDPLAIEVYDKITVGRTIGKQAVDLDLSPFLALELGVSRVHATLEPTDEVLLLHDQDSTNGTFRNFKSIVTGSPQKIENNDILSLGALNFQVKIIRYPEGAK
jgi:hypothetical protein